MAISLGRLFSKDGSLPAKQSAEPSLYSDIRWRDWDGSQHTQQLRRELGCALAKMGFFLDGIATSKCKYDFDAMQISGLVVCPCGGTEVFSMMIAMPQFSVAEDRMHFEVVVRSVCDEFVNHIRKEVTEGTLPATWLERL